MTTDDIFFAVRTINFLWAFALFMILVYYGVIDIILTRRCSQRHLTSEMQWWASASLWGCLSVTISLAEIFLHDVPGGWRVFSIWPFLFCVTVAVFYGARRVRAHKVAVSTGHC